MTSSRELASLTTAAERTKAAVAAAAKELREAGNARLRGESTWRTTNARRRDFDDALERDRAASAKRDAAAGH